MHSFSDSFPLWLITGYWIQSPVLGTRTLFIHPVYNRLHLLISNPYSIPPLTRPSSLATARLSRAIFLNKSNYIFPILKILHDFTPVILIWLRLWSLTPLLIQVQPHLSPWFSLNFPRPHLKTFVLSVSSAWKVLPQYACYSFTLSVLFTSFTLPLKPVLTTPLAVLLSLLKLCFFHQTHLYLIDPLNVFLIVNPLKKKICLFIFCQFPSA